MDEYNQGMDPAVKKYFRKIVNSFVVGLGWLMVFAISGIYFRLGVIQDKLRWYNVLFYLLFLATLIWLIRYFHKTWNSGSDIMRDDPPAHS
jgi:hypothetical protein